MAYNGWSNYETWCVKLHMDNDESSQRYWDRQAKEAVRDFEGPDGCIPVLADWLEDWHKEDMPTVTGVYADLLNASLSEVNWHEIARNLVEEYREEVRAMPSPYDELYRIVWFHLQGDRPRVRLREVREAIGQAHYSDRRDGVVVTNDNAGLFRMFRNNVSPDPHRLIAAAKAYGKEVSNA